MQDKPLQCICDNANGLHWGKCPLNMQAAPRGEQEWTPEYVTDIVFPHPPSTKTPSAWQRIADAHNAALAAEREKLKPLVEALGGISGLCNTPVNYPVIFAKDIKRICDDALAKVTDHDEMSVVEGPVP